MTTKLSLDELLDRAHGGWITELGAMPTLALPSVDNDCGCDDPDYDSGDCECHNCGECICDSNRLLWNYSYKPFGSHYVDFVDDAFVLLPVAEVRNQMLFGLELEVESRHSSDAWDNETEIRRFLRFLNIAFGSTKSNDQAVWIGKEDGTVDVEFVSAPFTYNAWIQAQEVLEPAMLYAQEHFRAFYASSAGAHIHVAKSTLSLTTMYAWIQFHYDNPGLIADIAQRGIGADAEWCYLQKPDISVARIAKQKYGFPGRGALADTAATIEHRYFRSNLKLERLNKNMEFLESMFQYFSNLTYQDMARDGAHKLHAYLGFVALNQATYPNLYSYLQTKGYISCV